MGKGIGAVAVWFVRRDWRRMRLLAAAVLGFVGAGPVRAGTSDPVSPRPVEDEVRLGYFANVTHAQAVLGVASGEFEKAVAPAKFTTRVFNAGPSLVEAMFAGEIDIGYVGPSPALNAHIQSRGQGIRVIAGGAANGVVIVARVGSGIERLEDLKGRRIATPQLGNTQDMSARHYLVKGLGQENADNVVPVPNSEQVSMMTRGQIDAAWAVEPWGTRLVAEAGGTIIAEEMDLWPDKSFVLTLVVVSPEFLKKHPDIVERILGVHCSWTRRLNESGKTYAPEIGAALEKVTGKKLSERIVAEAVSRVKFTDEPLAGSIATLAQWAFDLGFSRSVPDVTTLVDTALLDKVRLRAAIDQKAATPGKP